MTTLATFALVLAGAAACKDKSTDKVDKAVDHRLASGDPKGSDPRAGSGSAGSAAPAAWTGKGPLLLSEGFATPESVLHDASADLYLVSNVNGGAAAADDNGYIARISPEGKITDPKWIDGAKDNIKLDAPKGLAITGGVLYVADITVVRMFDAKTGEPRGDVAIDGATFLNDLEAAPDGGVFVTDSGLDAKFAASGADAIYRIGADGKVSALLKDKTLGAPNGVLATTDGAVWVVTFKSGEIFSVDAKGKKQAAKKLPKGQLDGIVLLDNGDVLVSSWEGQSIYRGRPGGSDWRPVVAAVQSPADIGLDRKRKRLLVPIFEGNSVLIQPLE